jgi:hypothetical protein
MSCSLHRKFTAIGGNNLLNTKEKKRRLNTNLSLVQKTRSVIMDKKHSMKNPINDDESSTEEQVEDSDSDDISFVEHEASVQKVDQRYVDVQDQDKSKKIQGAQASSFHYSQQKKEKVQAEIQDVSKIGVNFLNSINMFFHVIPSYYSFIGCVYDIYDQVDRYKNPRTVVAIRDQRTRVSKFYTSFVILVDHE